MFVLHDDIQYTKQDWRNRNRVKTANGSQWLTVPVQKATTGGAIIDVRIDNTRDWYRKHWRMIEQAYYHAPHFKTYRGFFADVYSHPWESLSELDIHLTEHICRRLGITTPLQRSSTMGITGVKTDRLVQMCQALDITHYLSGPSAQAYIEPEKFEAIGVTVEYQDYDYPAYPQLHGAFDPFVSILDLLFNCGEESPQYIWGSTGK